MIRDTYAQATTLFVDATARIQEHQWTQMALGEWTVRDLVGHTLRALLTVEMYLDKPAKSVDLSRPMDYFLRAKASLGDPAAVAERGREAGKALGDDPAATVQATATRVLARLASEPDAALVTTPVGGMRLIDYLPTRIFELTIHTLDLATAIDLKVTVPDAAAQLVFAIVGDLALQTGQVAPLLLAATGRGPLPAGFSVL
jgi:uncharacterized protein (TIGR03083 family)